MDRIYKNIKTGEYTDELGEAIEIKEVFRNLNLFVFSGDKNPLIIAEWNVVAAAWLVLAEYELTSLRKVKYEKEAKIIDASE